MFSIELQILNKFFILIFPINVLIHYMSIFLYYFLNKSGVKEENNF